MSAVVILSVVKFSRFLVKDKSENTFIKICHAEWTKPHDDTKLENILQTTTRFWGLVHKKPQEARLQETKKAVATYAATAFVSMLSTHY